MRSENGNPDFVELPYYYMLSATGLTFFVALFGTTTIVVGMNGLAKLQKAEKIATGRRASEVSSKNEHCNQFNFVTA